MHNNLMSARASGFACPTCGDESAKEVISYPSKEQIELRCTECSDWWIESLGGD